MEDKSRTWSSFLIIGSFCSPGNFLIDDDGDNASITLQDVLDDDIWIDDMS